MSTETAIERARTKAGGLTKLATALGIKPPSVAEWIKRGLAPPERCIAIEEATGGKVTRYELRPDVFGPAPADSKKRRAA